VPRRRAVIRLPCWRKRWVLCYPPPPRFDGRSRYVHHASDRDGGIGFQALYRKSSRLLMIFCRVFCTVPDCFCLILFQRRHATTHGRAFLSDRVSVIRAALGLGHSLPRGLSPVLAGFVPQAQRFSQLFFSNMDSTAASRLGSRLRRPILIGKLTQHLLGILRATLDLLCFPFRTAPRRELGLKRVLP